MLLLSMILTSGILNSSLPKPFFFFPVDLFRTINNCIAFSMDGVKWAPGAHSATKTPAGFWRSCQLQWGVLCLWPVHGMFHVFSRGQPLPCAQMGVSASGIGGGGWEASHCQQQEGSPMGLILLAASQHTHSFQSEVCTALVLQI